MSSENALSSSTPNVTIEHMHIEYSVYYAIQHPVNEHPDSPALIIATHGYGQSCKGFIKHFADQLDRNVLVVAPQGANQFYWQQSPAKIGFTWMTSYMRENTIADNMAYMKRLMGTIQERYTFDPKRVFTLGFSQGVAMAFRIAAAQIHPLAGVIACGGDLPPDVAEQLPTMDPLSVLIVHGEQDNRMSTSKAREGEATLRDHNFSVDTHYFEGKHDIPPAQVNHIMDWVDRH